MELSNDQVEAIRESLQKLAALGGVVSFICETGVPPDDVLCGWQLLIRMGLTRLLCAGPSGIGGRRL